jgi:hypothetical protein
MLNFPYFHLYGGSVIKKALIGLMSVSALVLPMITPAMAAAETSSPSTDRNGFTCMAPHEECLAAVHQARSVDEALQILERRAAARRVQREAVARLDEPSGYGLTTIPGAGDGRYYGWRLSRNLLGRSLTYDTCVVNPSGSVCHYTGTIRVHANFRFNGFDVRDIETSVFYEDGPTAASNADLKCDEKGSLEGECGEQEILGQVISEGTTLTFFFTRIHLADNNNYDISFAWSMVVPQFTAAWSGWYDSLDFRKDNSAVYYPGFGEGDSA